MDQLMSLSNLGRNRRSSAADSATGAGHPSAAPGPLSASGRLAAGLRVAVRPNARCHAAVPGPGHNLGALGAGLSRHWGGMQ